MSRAPDPVQAAVCALASRDRSAHELEEWLARRGVPREAGALAVARLARAGYVDDGRFAMERARVLAERGYGDAAIRQDLARRRVAGDAIEAALDGLDAEVERAHHAAARLGGAARAARTLARKGFREESLEAAVRPLHTMAEEG